MLCIIQLLILNMIMKDEWIIDPFVKEMIQDVDKSTVLDSGVIDMPGVGENTANWVIRRCKKH